LRPSSETSVTLCVIGDQASGKTCLCERFINDSFSEEYVPSFIPAVYSKKMKVSVSDSPREVELTIKDVLGNLAYERLISSAFEGCEGALAVYDPNGDTDPDTLPRWINALYNLVGDIPLVFVINKCDLGDCEAGPDEELERTVQSFRSACFTTSALTGANVEMAFERLVMDVLVRKELERYDGVIV
jgi:small GTP-binding protein